MIRTGQIAAALAFAVLVAASCGTAGPDGGAPCKGGQGQGGARCGGDNAVSAGGAGEAGASGGGGGASVTCGDGEREGDEACDGGELGGATCGDLGFIGGVLACGPLCSFDTGECCSGECSPSHEDAALLEGAGYSTGLLDPIPNKVLGGGLSCMAYPTVGKEILRSCHGLTAAVDIDCPAGEPLKSPFPVQAKVIKVTTSYGDHHCFTSADEYASSCEALDACDNAIVLQATVAGVVWRARLAHVSAASVVEGDTVAPLGPVGSCGDVGWVCPGPSPGDDGAHLHLEVYREAPPSAGYACPEILLSDACAVIEPGAGCPAPLHGAVMVQIPTPGGGTMCIDPTEVTKRDYAEFIADTGGGQGTNIEGLGFTCEWNDSYVPTESWPPAGDEEHPVVGVDWCDAYAYCKWAGKRLCGKIGGGPGSNVDFEFADQSQWMNACSSGGKKKYPHGNAYDPERCNVLENSTTGCSEIGWPCPTIPVGSFPGCHAPPPYAGVYDMSGNVREWEDSCMNTADPYSLCRIRGGSVYDIFDDIACDAEVHAPRTNDSIDLGLRCCGP